MRFSEAIKVYLNANKFDLKPSTGHGHDLVLRNFAIFLHDPLITTVTDMHVMDWFNLHMTLGYDQNNLLHKSLTLRKFFKYWRQKKYPVMDHELVPKVKRLYTRPPRVATEGELQALLKACDSYQGLLALRNKAIVMLFADTGIRNTELCNLPARLDTENYEIVGGVKVFSHVIKTLKTQSNPFRRIFWYEETNKIVNEWKTKRYDIVGEEDSELFIGVRGHSIGARLNNTGITVIFRTLSKKAGLRRMVNPHSLRHKLGNDLAQNQANNSTISSILGHTSLNSSKIYTDLNDKQMAEAHVKFKKKSTAD
jgi:site-specific recombinase XerD